MTNLNCAFVKASAFYSFASNLNLAKLERTRSFIILFAILMFASTTNTHAQACNVGLSVTTPATSDRCDDLSYEVTLTNVASSSFSNGMLNLPAGVDFVSISGAVGATVTGDPSGAVNITNVIGPDIMFTVNTRSGCNSVSGDQAVGFDVSFECNALITNLSESNLVTFEVWDVEIVMSNPSPISIVEGFDFDVTVSVNNSESVTPATSYYCIYDNTSATLNSVTFNSTPLTLAPTSPAGQTCYLLPLLVQNNAVDIVENWIVDNCTSPADALRRDASAVCDGTICTSDIETTVLEVNVPDPIVILTVTDPSDIAVCGDPVVIGISIEYIDDYPGISLENILGSFTLPIGVTPISIDNVIGGTASLVGTDVSIGDLTSGATITFDLNIEANCDIVDPFIYMFDLSYDPLCPGTNESISYTSGNVTVNSPNIDISNSTPPFFNALIGLEQSITNTVMNSGNADAENVTYCVLDNPNVTLSDISVGGTSLVAAPSSPAGQSCFIIPSAIAQGDMIEVVETFTVISCNSTTDPILRRAQFGCGMDSDCLEETQGQFPLTTLTYNVPDPILNIDIDFVNNLSICGPSETATISVTYTNGQDVDLTNVDIELTLPDNISITSITSLSGGTATPDATNTMLDITDLEANTTFVFEAELVSGCGMGGLSQTFDVSLTHDPLCEGAMDSAMATSDGYSLQSANLSVLSDDIQGNIRTDMNIFDAVLDENGTLKVPVVNAGAGVIEEFTYFVINPSSVAIQSVAVGGVTLTPTSMSGDTVFYTVGADVIIQATQGGVADGDTFFEENEAIIMCETWLGTECQSGQLDPIMRGARFGCEGEICASSNISSTGINFDFAGPDLEIATYAPYTYRPACYDTENTEYGFSITNNGLAAAKDVTFEIHQEFYTGAIVGSSLMYSINDDTGPFTAATIANGNLNTNYTCVSGADNYRSLNAEMLDVDLAPGDVLYFKYEIDHSCNCRACDVLYIYGNNVRSVTFTDPCDKVFIDNTDYTRSRFNARYFGFLEGESNSPATGGCLRYSVTDAQNTWFSNNGEFPNAYLEIKLTAECGMDIDPSSIMWVDADGTINTPTIINGTDNNGVGLDDDIIVRFSAPYPSGFSTSGDTGLEFCYTPDCNEKPGGGCSSLSSITVQPTFVTDPTCVACTENADCGTPFPISFDCPGCGPCDGMTHTNLDIRRVNYGLPDADNDLEPDGGVIIDTSTIAFKRFLTGDTLKATFEGIVNDADNSETWVNAFATLDINSANFTILGGTLKVFDASNGGMVRSCEVLSQFADGTRLVTDISADVLSGLTCSDFDGFEYEDQDSVVVCVFYKTKDELINQTSENITYNSWFYLSDDVYAQGDTARCNFLFENMQQIGIRNFHNDIISGRNFGGCELSPFVLRSDLNYGGLGFDEFPNEIRPVGTPDRIIFTKPSEFAFRNDQHSFRYRQYIGADTDIVEESDVIPVQFFLEDGNELTFLAKDYLESLGDPRLPMDEGGIFWFYPAIQGNCLSEIGTYASSFQAVYEVDEQVFCSPTYEVAETTENWNYTGGPQLEITTPTPINDLTEPLGCVVINLKNTTNLDAPFSFINIQATTGGLVVQSLTETTDGMSAVITPTSFGIYPLSTTDAGDNRTFELCVNVTDCDPQILDFSAGWDCVEYPTTVEEATCADPSSIQFNTLLGDLDGQLVSPENNISVDLCDTVEFIYKMSSTQVGSIKDVLFDFSLPGDMIYVPGSYEVSYPVPFDESMAVFEFFQDPVLVSGSTYSDTVTSHYGELDSFGLVGSPGAITNANVILAKFKARTDCGFISGTAPSFGTSAKDACNNPTETVSTPGVKVQIADNIPGYDINIDLDDLTLNPCNEDESVIEIALVLDADPGVMTALGDSTFITLPPGIEYTGIYNNISNAATPPIIIDMNGKTLLKMPLETGLSDGDQVIFDLGIRAVDVGQACNIYDIEVQTVSTREEMCGTENCDIKVLSGEAQVQVSIQKPQLDIDDLDLTLSTMPPNMGTLNYTIVLENNGLVPQLASQDINLELYSDSNNNGFVDFGTDPLVTTVVENVFIPAGQSVTITGSVPLPPTGLCNVIGAINAETTCTCFSSTSNQIKVEIENNFTEMVEVCSGDIVSIGPDPISGYDYEWIGVGSASEAALSSTVVTMTDFQFDNNSGSNIVWDYALRTSFETCYSFDTVQVTLFPNNDATVSPQACIGSSFLLPGPGNGSNFLTTPSAGLDDAFSQTPMVTNIVAGATTYTMTYDDENGCPTERIFNLNGITCAPNTGIGDTVFFDINLDGIQDMNEVGIPNVTVFLYNSTNTTPGSHIGIAMTDANGFYIFENIPSGNYIVGFDSPAGFLPTIQDVAGNDETDSDIDPGTGLTGPYFIPNGVIDSTADAGFIPDCSLMVNIANVSECQFLDPGQQREVTIDIDWTNAVYTYDFLGGSDTIVLNVLGQEFKLPITTLSGSTSVNVIMEGGTADQDIIATINLTDDPACMAMDEMLGISACIYDVAMIKDLAPTVVPVYGQDLPFEITVVNQGQQPLNNIKINDYLPVGMTFNPATNMDWMQSGDTLMYLISDTLDVGEMVQIPLNLTLIMSDQPNAYLNLSEIASFQDTLDTDRSAQDIDSTPDNDPTNDAGGLADSGSDDSLVGDGTGAPGDNNPNTDEDDEDPELVSIVDVALVKNIVTPGPYMYGQAVTFEIVISNQGNVDLQNIIVNDFIPSGYSYLPVNNPSWSESAGTATHSVSMLSSLTDTTLQIILQIEEAGADDYVNIAEIESFENLAGNDITNQDIDSRADNDPTNDAGGLPGSDSDGSLNGNGTGNALDSDAATDEDDMDVAFLSIPMLDVTKTTTGVVMASSGVQGNFDVTFEIELENTGTTKLNSIKLQDNLQEQIGGTFIGVVGIASITTSDATMDPTINSGYNGAAIDSIFTGIDGCLRVDESLTVELTIEVVGLSGTDVNEATGMAIDSLGIMVMDMDTAIIAIPTCFLAVECPLLDQGTFECVDEIPIAATDLATFNAIDSAAEITNFCQTPSVMVAESMTGTGCAASPLIVTRVYTITDAGDPDIGPESVTCTIRYTIIDDVKPIVMVEASDLFLECAGNNNTNDINTWIANRGGAMVAEACSTVSWTNVAGTSSDDCGNSNTTPYVFTATDLCGNSVSVTANIVITDTTDPAVVLPTTVDNAECGGTEDAILATWLADASGTDDCGSVTVSSALVSLNELCNGTNSSIIHTYIFIVTDECGNVSTATDQFTINDTTAPVITAPADLTLACGDDVSLLIGD